MGYSKQFKQQAMRLVTEKGYTPSRASRELGMPNQTLMVWLHKAGWHSSKPEPVLLPESPLSEDPAVLKVRVRELEEENRRLRMEKDILKKATAFFASQNP